MADSGCPRAFGGGGSCWLMVRGWQLLRTRNLQLRTINDSKASQSLEDIDRADDICLPSFDGFAVGEADERLGGEMENKVGLGGEEGFLDRICIAQVVAVPFDAGGKVELFEERWGGRRGKREAMHLRPQ